jgi:hypothetical protein
MGKSIIALVMGFALFGTLAFANEFGVNTGAGQPGQSDISSGDTDINPCNHNVEVDLVVNGFNASQGDFIVGQIRVNADPGCVGDHAKVQLTSDQALNTPIGSPFTCDLDAVGDCDIDASGANIAVGLVKDLHIAIEADNSWP